MHKCHYASVVVGSSQVMITVSATKKLVRSSNATEEPSRGPGPVLGAADARLPGLLEDFFVARKPIKGEASVH